MYTSQINLQNRHCYKVSFSHIPFQNFILTILMLTNADRSNLEWIVGILLKSLPETWYTEIIWLLLLTIWLVICWLWCFLFQQDNLSVYCRLFCFKFSRRMFTFLVQRRAVLKRLFTLLEGLICIPLLLLPFSQKIFFWIDSNDCTTTATWIQFFQIKYFKKVSHSREALAKMMHYRFTIAPVSCFPLANILSFSVNSTISNFHLAKCIRKFNVNNTIA